MMGIMKKLGLAKRMKKVKEPPKSNQIERDDVWYMNGIRYQMVPSESGGDEEYCVTRHPSGKMECTCKHFKVRLQGKGKLCKHAIKVYQELKEKK